mmetsp:Transcript_15978/g.22226  ORF Transcript_15978/g.22226 Transcript_15978/m.22226 type:complete len:312 (+) Transcript_15978:37-972(+)
MISSTEFKDDECPLCRSELYLNPNMKLVQAICGHKFCDTCINRNFLSKAAFVCPICKTSLKKGNFMQKMDEDPEFEKELSIRKSIMKDFNKRREDFKTLREFNDYLEQAEDIIFNLANGIDVERTQEKIRKYKQENQELIIINQSKRAESEREVQARLMAEQMEREERRKRELEEEQMQKLQQLKQREETLEGLASGKISAASLKKSTDLKKPSAKKKVEPTPIVPTPIQTKPVYSYTPQNIPQQPTLPQPVKATAPPPAFALPQPIEGTKTTTMEESQEKRKTAAKAAGWKDEYVTNRSLEEAFGSLFVF